MRCKTVYQRVYSDKPAGGVLHTDLRCQKKSRKRYGSGHSRIARNPTRVGIERRYPHVEARSTVGHWEAETMLGRNKKSMIVTLLERKSGYVVARRVLSWESHHVEKTVIDALQEHSRPVRTIPFDNCLEFAAHKRVALLLAPKTYFSNPCSPWQHGPKETWDGLLQPYFPKQRCLRAVLVAQLQAS